MKITKSIVTIVLGLVIAGCMRTAKEEIEVPPELVELLNGLKVSYQIEKTDIEYLQSQLDQSRETKSNITSGQFIDLLSGQDSVQALQETEQQILLRASAYLLKHIEILDGLRTQPGAISGPFSELFLDGVTGHYYLGATCTTTFGITPPIYKTGWFTVSCPATNGTVCNFNNPQTYTLYWCQE